MNQKVAGLYPAHFKELVARHERALEATGYDSLLIYAGGQQMIFLDDMAYPFKPNPHFKAWAPVLNNPNCLILFTPGKKPLLLYHQPVDYWHKPAETPSGFWVDHFEIRLIAEPDEAKGHLPPSSGKRAFIGEWDPKFASWGLSDPNPSKLLGRLHFERAWKTAYEIECMREANRMGVRGHRAAEKAWRDGASEYETHLEFLRSSSQTEAEVPYGNIVAQNENAAVLHYQHRDRRRLSNRHSFLIDAGADYNGYASDITRTYAAKSDGFQALIDAMEKAQQEICAAVKPGVDYRTLHMSAHEKIAEILAAHKLVDLVPAAIVERKITSTFLPHGLGHYIGLQVHDVAGFAADADGSTIPKPDGHPFLRLTRVIEERHVFTIEPGLYFIDSLLAELRAGENGTYVDWRRIDEFRKYGGIRIEDDLVVTKDGAENLTRDQFAAVA